MVAAGASAAMLPRIRRVVGADAAERGLCAEEEAGSGSHRASMPIHHDGEASARRLPVALCQPVTGPVTGPVPYDSVSECDPMPAYACLPAFPGSLTASTGCKIGG